ncbi:hypothetical protein M501DRAFT_939467, partial [Patellaria atrata CBS 101060]
PDTYYGADPLRLELRVREDLSHFVQPKKDLGWPVLPSFFIEVKGPEGNAAVLKRQSVYDSVLTARRIQHLRTYYCDDEDELFDGAAYVLCATFNDGRLRFYATHVVRASNRNGMKNHHTEIMDFAIDNRQDEFVKARAAMWNARQWTDDRRNEMIDAANAFRPAQGDQHGS